MPDTPDIALKIRVVGAEGKLLAGAVDIEFQHRTLTDHGVQRGLDASREIDISGLRRAPAGNYQVTVTPADGFKPKSQFVNLPAKGFATMEFVFRKEGDHVASSQPCAPDTFVWKRPLTLGSTGAEVRFLQCALRQLAYEIPIDERSDETFGPGTQRALERFQGESGLRVNGQFDETTARELLARWNTLPPVSAYVVHGTVRRADGSRAGDTLVRAFDKRLRSDTMLGYTRTDTCGHYQISYQPIRFDCDRPTRVDLVVRAVVADAGCSAESVLAESPVWFQAPTEALVDLMEGGATWPGPSEFERIRDDLGVLLRGVDLKDLTDAEVELLAAQSERNADQVTFFVRAAQFADQYSTVGVPAEAFYAFFRAGETTDVRRLVLVDAVRLFRALDHGFASNFIPYVSEGARANWKAIILARMRDLATAVSLQDPSDGRSLGGILAAAGAGGDTRAQKDFASAYLNWNGPMSGPSGFWARARQLETVAPHVDRLQRTIQFGTLTSNHLPSISALLARWDTYAGALSANATPSVGDMLGGMTSDDWDSLMTASGTPPDVPGADDAERRLNYRRILMGRIERALPTHYVWRRLGGANLPNLSAVTGFLQKNASGFDLRRGILDHYLSNGGASSTLSVAEIESVKTLQRLYKVSPTLDHTLTLLKMSDARGNPLSSARHIASMGRDGFAKAFTAASATDPTTNNSGSAAADGIYSLASWMSDASTMTAAGALGELSEVPVGSISPPLSTDIGNPFANLQTLLGSLDFCNCEWCRSVYSPAAYLVDLLATLDKVPINQKTAKEYLYYDQGTAPTLRRADIGKIPLTCENTNTLLVYIDLVNEVLEQIASDPIPNTPPAPLSTTRPAEELRLLPEHVQPDVYDSLLASQIHPWSLPFNLALEEARAFLGQLGTGLAPLMEAFQDQGKSQPTDVQIAVERLGLSPVDYGILKGTVPKGMAQESDFYAHWGFTSQVAKVDGKDQDWKVALHYASYFIVRSGLSPQDFIDLMATSYVKTTLQVSYSWPTNECNLDGTTITGLDRSKLVAIARFVRLQRKLGWTYRQLDRFMALFGQTFVANSVFDDALFLRLSVFERIRQAYGLDFDELYAWWGTIDITTDANGSSQFNRLFPVQSTAMAGMNVFVLANGDLPPGLKMYDNPNPPIDILPLIASGIGISAAEVKLVLTSKFYSVPNLFTVANLSRLHGIASLCRVARISVAEYLLLRDLIVDDPFDSAHATAPDPSLAWSFIQKVQLIRDAGFRPVDLDYLLRSNVAPTSGLSRSPDAIAQALTELRDGLRKIAQEEFYPPLSFGAAFPPPDSHGDLTHRSLLAAVPFDIAEPAFGFLSFGPQSLLRPLAQNSQLTANGAASLPGPLSPDLPGNLSVTFGIGWDGGDITITGTGTDASGNPVTEEVIPASPSQTITGQVRFTTITGISKPATPLASAANAFIGQAFAWSPADWISVNGIHDRIVASSPTAIVGPFHSPDGPRPLAVSFEDGWDATSITVNGLDAGGLSISETFAFNPADGAKTVIGRLAFQNVQGATKKGVGAASAGAFIGFVRGDLRTAATASAVGGPFPSDAAQIGGPFRNPEHPDYLTITADPDWDGGATVTISGTDANDAILTETIALKAGSTVPSANVFKTVTGATKGMGNPQLNASIGTAVDGADHIRKAFGSDGPVVVPGPFTNPSVPAVLKVAFDAHWDGGIITVTGTDVNGAPISDTFAPGAGMTVTGGKIFKTVTGATKQYVGMPKPSLTIGVLRPDTRGFANLVSVAAPFSAYVHPQFGAGQLHVALSDPDRPRLLAVTFAADWDGGDITITGKDASGGAITEVFPAAFGQTLVGKLEFAKVTGATVAVTAQHNTPNHASIGTVSKTQTEVRAYVEYNTFIANQIFGVIGVVTFAALLDQLVDNSAFTSVGLRPRPVRVAAADRFAPMLSLLLAYLSALRSTALVNKKLAEALKLDTRTAGALLTVHDGGDGSKGRFLDDFTDLTSFVGTTAKVTEDGFGPQFRAFRTLEKGALLASKLRLKADEVSAANALAGKGGWLALSDLPFKPTSDSAYALFDKCSRLAAFVNLRNGLPKVTPSIWDILARINQPPTQNAADYFDGTKTITLYDDLQSLTGRPRADIAAICGTGALESTKQADFADGTALIRIKSCLNLLDRLGTSAAKAVEWRTPSLMLKEAENIRGALRSHYDRAGWYALAQPLQDRFRQAQRDALVAYICARDNLNADQLFDRYLIDPEMSACQLTSRIKQAIGSVQLFFQRATMGLEKDVTLDQGDAQHAGPARQWKTWLRNYRVWEANRKVFLYPENWLELSLRDDKTPFFMEMEKTLTHGDINTDLVEDAYLKYLERLDEVALLDVRTIYRQGWQDKEGNKRNALHILARTSGTPQVYYYRRLVEDSSWTPWEKVDVDISGEILIAVVYDGRLRLYWPIFQHKTVEATSSGNIGDGKGPGPLPQKYLQIQLAWSEYKQGRWSAKKVTTESIHTLQDPARDYLWDELVFRPATGEQVQPLFAAANSNLYTGQESDLWIVVQHRVNNEVGWFVFNDGGSPPTTHNVDTEAGKVFAVPPVLNNTQNEGMQLVANSTVVVATTETKSSSFDFVWPNDPFAIAQDIDQFRKFLNTGALPQITGLPHDPTQVSFSLSWPEDWKIVADVGAMLSGFPPPFGPFPPGVRVTLTTQVSGSHLAVNQDWSLSLRDLGGINEPKILGRGTDQYRLAHHTIVDWDPSDRGPTWGEPPMFYMDGRRCYSILRSLTDASVLSRLADPSEADPAFLIANDVDAPTSNTLPDCQNQIYQFETFFHPQIHEFIRVLNESGIDHLLDFDTQSSAPITPAFEDPTEGYAPTDAVYKIYPRGDVDFSWSGAYSQYNWELFFHAPLMIAERLSKNQKFDDAMKWFHYIFDPTHPEIAQSIAAGETNEKAIQHAWRFKPFRNRPVLSIQDLLNLLDTTDKDPLYQEAQRRVVEEIEAWRADPFNPFLIARQRQSAFMYATIMKYVDTLIAWGDQLFRQDTIESINQATQLYILAREVLGPKPESFPARAQVLDKSYDSLALLHLDEFSNAVVTVENWINPPADAPAPKVPLPAATVLYFCIPPNDKLLAYWGTIDDRLFKIRHCLNFEGIFQQLPLFEPPIDPALLLRGAATGVDLSSVLNDANTPLPNYRFSIMLQKALEFCGDVKALGSAMLQALEKDDAEALALLRSEHEIALLQAVRDVKQRQLDETNATLEGLQKTQEMVQIRRDYYGSREFMSPWELEHIALTIQSAVIQDVAAAQEAAAALVRLIPQFNIGVEGWAATPTSTFLFGGDQIGSALQAFAANLRSIAGHLSTKASLSATMGGYYRRKDDWDLQKDLAAKELEQVSKQIDAATIRADIAQKDLDNQDLQIENTKKVDYFMHEKFTNAELCDWMVQQLSSIYFQSYQLAYDLAKAAERAFRFERGDDGASFIHFGYWDSLKKGLLAGERLHYDLRRMDAAWLEQNKREHEITKHISLGTYFPLALVALKETGSCTIDVGEKLFDFDFPGHYMRRLKTVAVTIPCTTGPYTGVNCKLSLLKNAVRRDPTVGSVYLETPVGADPRFRYDYSAAQSIVTSTGQNDGGMFEVNLRDERYLPFEGAGAISTWRIDLAQANNAFEVDTISDVILHVRYTARDGGDVLAAAVPPPSAAGVRFFSAKHDFPSDWYRFLNPPALATEQDLNLKLTLDRFPFLAQSNPSLQSTTIKIVVKPGPAANVQAGSSTRVTLTAPNGASLTSPLNGAPIGAVFQKDFVLNDSPGAWRLSVAQGSALGDTGANNFLTAATVEDIGILFFY